MKIYKWPALLSMLAFLCLNLSTIAQQSNKYGLEIISQVEDYQKSVEENPNKELVDLSQYIPDLIFDIRYASNNNFAKTKVYELEKAYLRKAAAESLKNAQNELNSMGLGLKIFDGYRPYAVTVTFYQLADKKEFVAHPKDGSRHNRGCAVDLTVINLKTGQELPMPTDYDDFTELASPRYTELPAEQIKNRDLLISIMHKHGFKVYFNEWWHFDFVGWEAYELMDISFEELERK
ncbi:M15 family metallopeptidase [Fulvivirgaceae bacterium LMO-SS25]